MKTCVKNEEIIDLRREFHQIPELGFREFKTSKKIANYLRSFGIETHENIARTGVVGRIYGKSRSNAIGYRADMDALPIRENSGLFFASTNDCMHACGHDAHLAMGLALAKHYAQNTELKRDLVFIFQPNEEGAPGDDPAGAKAMIDEGILERFDIQQCLALHCDPDLETGSVGYKEGAVWAASRRFVFEVHGESSHGAYPERGRDALKGGVFILSALFDAMTQTLAQDERFSVCRFEAGRAYNVIADLSRFEGLMRGSSSKILDKLSQRARDIAENVAALHNLDLSFQFHDGASAVFNDKHLSQKIKEILTPQEILTPINMRMGSEDFCYFSEKVPSFYGFLGVKEKGLESIPPLHSSKFFIDEEALIVGFNAMRSIIDKLQ